MAAVLVAFVVVGVLLFGGSDGYRYTLLFQTGGQIVPGNEVLVAGQRVGMVDSIDLTDNNEAAIKVDMQEPLREGTTALIRTTSLSGVANRYISLAPGPNNSPEIEPGSTISGEDTTSPVDVDQLFNIFRPKQREALQKFIQGNATVYAGKGQLANRAYKFLNPSLSTSTKLFAELSSDSAALSRFLVSGGKTFSALADRREDLSSLVVNANATLAAIASRNDDLDRSLAAFPETLRQLNTTQVNLRTTLDDLDPLVEASYPATENLAPFLRRLSVVADDSTPVFTKLADIARLPGPDNDLADTLNELPTTKKRGKRALPDARQALNDSVPDLTYLRAYSPDLIAGLTKLGETTAFYDGNGHYLRLQPAPANVFDYDSPAPGQAEGNIDVPISPPGAPAPPQFPIEPNPPYFLNPINRCPGAGGAPAPDGSNPFVSPAWPNSDLTAPADCDPSDIAPGP